MKKVIVALIFTLLYGCSSPNQLYYTKSNLNTISIGMYKNQLLNKFPGGNRPGDPPPMMIRAAKKHEGKLIEVAEVLLTDGVSPTMAYWFLFEDAQLVQWGQPADWKQVGARYEISYTPSVGIN